MVDLDLVADLTERVRNDGFCLLKGIIPPAEVEEVRRGFLRARDAHREAVTQPAQPGRRSGMVQPEATTKAIEAGLSEIQQTLTDPSTSRSQAIALVDGLAQNLRAQGIVALNEPADPEVVRAAHFPLSHSCSKHDESYVPLIQK